MEDIMRMFDEFFEKMNGYEELMNEDSDLSFLKDENNKIMNEKLIEEAEKINLEEVIDDLNDLLIAKSALCIAYSNRLLFLKEKEGMLDNGIYAICSSLDEKYRKFEKVFNDEIVYTCNKMLELIKFLSTFKEVGVVYENMAAYVYAELCATYFFTNNEEGFLDAALKGISLKSIDCANFYISYLYEKDRIQEAKVVFDDIFFKEYEKSTIIHFPTYFVTTESALRFIYKGFLNTGKYDLAKEYLIKNREFIEQSKNELNKTDYYSLCNEINEKSFIELEKYEGNNLIDLDYSLLYSVFDENIIEKMPNKVKQFIVTSIEVFNFLSTNFNNLDYSSAVMPIMRCLESLLYNIIGKSFIPYLKEELEQGRLDFDELPQELVVRSRVTGKKVFIGNPDWVTLGNALTWTSYNIRGNNYPNDLFLDYCYEYLDNNYEKTAQQFIDGLRNIKPKRNKAAHTEVVTFEDAKECNDYLLTVNKFIAFLINNFSFCITKEEK